MLSDKKVLVTGATGQIGLPVAKRLAADNEVWCAARFSDPAAKAEIEALGITACPWSLGSGDFSTLPTDFTHVIHSAFLARESSHDVAINVNAVGAGTLMQHCRRAEAFLFVSAFAIYKRLDPQHAHAETDPLGGHATYMPAYPIAKIATEGTVRAAATMLQLPTTIARMNVGYGTASHGGLPVTFFGAMLRDEPIAVPTAFDLGVENWASPIAEADIAEQASEALFEIASVPATVLNWAGDDAVSHRQICEYLGGLAGLTPRFVQSAVTYDSFISDNTRRTGLIGRCKTHWQDGIRAAIELRFPAAIPVGSKPLSGSGPHSASRSPGSDRASQPQR
jgi:UDP-glucuronate 4-epimerase